ncbi:MAG: hypothetical protein RLY97_274 [Pseudomonadota bacterium]|jgi:iron complex outermembrane recepter protein
MKSISTVSIFAIAMGIASPTWAQTAPTPATAQTPAQAGLEEIIVTATKRSENLQNVPVAVSAITQAALQKQGVFETTDLNHAIPNFQVSSPYGTQQPNFSVRGIGVGTEFNANAASPVGVYVDEVYQTFRASHGQQLYDLNQVEVVRGPQGTLYGRNTTGGTINFNTRAPSLSGINGYATIGYGNYSRRNAEGAIEFTPVEGVLGIRLAGTYVKSDPYLVNKLAAGTNTSAAFGLSGLNKNSGISPGGNESYGFRGTIRFKPSAGVDLSLKAYAARSEGGTENALPTGQSQTSDVINYRNANFLLAPLFQALVPAGLLPGTYSASANGLTTQQLQVDTVGKAITRAEGVVFNAKIKLSDHLRLISITGYDSGRYQQTATDCDATPNRLCSIGYASRFNAFNQDIRLDYSNGPTKFILGVYYGRDSITADNTPDFFNFLRDVNTAVGSPAGYFNPGGAFGAALPPGSLPTGITATQHFTQVRKSKAIYGEGSYQVAPTLKATVGLRYTADTNDFKDGITTYFDDTGAARMLSVSNYAPGGVSQAFFIKPVLNQAGTVVIPASAGALPGGLTRHGSSNRLSGRFILDWKPSDSMLVYASFSRGYRAGTFNGLAYGSANQVYFVKPESINAYETGIKSRFLDNRLQINASLFYYDYKGQQGQVVDASATANLISLDGSMKGAELDVQFAASRSLHLSASLGLLSSKYADGACPAAAITATFPAQLGSCVVSSGGQVSVAGNPFPYAPKTTANLGFDWDAYHVGDTKLTLHGDAAFSGQFYYDSFANYSRGPLPAVASGVFNQGSKSYWMENARATVTHKNMSVSFWVKNLTNKTYYPFGISIENLFGNGYRVRGQPRTFGAEATVKF